MKVVYTILLLSISIRQHVNSQSATVNQVINAVNNAEFFSTDESREALNSAKLQWRRW